MQFYIDQILFILIAYISSKKEVYATWAYREFAPPGTSQSKLYHQYSGIIISIIMILSAYAFSHSIVNIIILSFINGFIYWLLFDIGYALGIKQPWYYLGNEASTDKLLKNKGKIKAYICVGFIVVLNLVHILFFK